MLTLNPSKSTRYCEQFSCDSEFTNETFNDKISTKNAMLALIEREYKISSAFLGFMDYYGRANDALTFQFASGNITCSPCVGKPILHDPTTLCFTISVYQRDSWLVRSSLPIEGEDLNIKVKVALIYRGIGTDPLLTTPVAKTVTEPSEYGVVDRSLAFGDILLYLNGQTPTDRTLAFQHMGEGARFPGDRLEIPLRNINLGWMLENSSRVMHGLARDTHFQKLVDLREALKAEVPRRSIARINSYLTLFGSDTLDGIDLGEEITRLREKTETTFKKELKKYQPSEDLRTLLKNI